MGGIQTPQSIQPRVMALFLDGADSFALPPGATLEELAGRIDGLGARHAGAPIAIRVHFDWHKSLEPPGIMRRQ